MGSSDELPVIAGLAVGIGFVVAFSIFLTPSLMNSDGSSNSAVVLGEEGQTIEIDFGIALPERDMVVKKGETIRVPVAIETQGSIEKVLSLSLMPYTFDSSEIAGELVLSLDRETVVLSEDDIAQGKARINDYGWVITDAGFLTITASPTATNGTFEYIVEASWAGEPGGTGMGSGQLITVTVTD